MMKNEKDFFPLKTEVQKDMDVNFAEKLNIFKKGEMEGVIDFVDSLEDRQEIIKLIEAVKNDLSIDENKAEILTLLKKRLDEIGEYSWDDGYDEKRFGPSEAA